MKNQRSNTERNKLIEDGKITSKKLEMVKQCYYQNVLYVTTKYEDLLKNKKQEN